MYTFRFNPLFKAWVVLGAPGRHEVDLSKAQLLGSERDRFVAAHNPNQPFVLDPPGKKAAAAPMLHEERPALGEYELLLHRGHGTLSRWKAKEWEGWLHLVQQRLRHAHHNPHLHHVRVSFHTGWMNTVGNEFARVGELIMTSHPVAGEVPLLEYELVEKLRTKERTYVLHDATDGLLYAPSAPLFEKEVWYVPVRQGSSITDAPSASRSHTADALALLFTALHAEWPEEHFVIELHTALVGGQEDVTWWLRVYQDARRVPATLTVLPLPEQFIRKLGSRIG